MGWCENLKFEKTQLTDIKSLGYSYLKQGAYEIASTFFAALAILDPEDPYSLQTLGAIELQLGNHLKALDLLDKALKLDPKHLPTILNKARALFFLGYKQQALNLANFLAQQPNELIQPLAKALQLVLSIPSKT